MCVCVGCKTEFAHCTPLSYAYNLWAFHEFNFYVSAAFALAAKRSSSKSQSFFYILFPHRHTHTKNCNKPRTLKSGHHWEGKVLRPKLPPSLIDLILCSSRVAEKTTTTTQGPKPPPKDPNPEPWSRQTTLLPLATGERLGTGRHKLMPPFPPKPDRDLLSEWLMIQAIESCLHFYHLSADLRSLPPTP